jgi:hypothetical protein
MAEAKDALACRIFEQQQVQQSKMGISLLMGLRRALLMLERIEGQGRLESIDLPTRVYQVGYRFDITSNLVRKPGRPAVATHRDSSGSVWSLDGKRISEAEYHLHAVDGEILKVQNAGMGEWCILADLP